MTKHHYVYRSYEEKGREYIGRRTCNCLPEEDNKYFGSFYDKTFSPTEKIILFVCETPEETAEIEIELHDFFDVAINPQFANRAKATSTKFDRTGFTGEKHPMFGVPHTEKAKKKMSVVNTGEKNPMFGLFGSLNPTSKAIIVIEPDGTQRHFGSIIEAARELGTHQGHLCGRYLKTGKSPTKGKFKGWQFCYQNSEEL